MNNNLPSLSCKELIVDRSRMEFQRGRIGNGSLIEYREKPLFKTNHLFLCGTFRRRQRLRVTEEDDRHGRARRAGVLHCASMLFSPPDEDLCIAWVLYSCVQIVRYCTRGRSWHLVRDPSTPQSLCLSWRFVQPFEHHSILTQACMM